MIFEQLNPNACRTYLTGDEKSREAVLIDPVLEHVEDYLRTLDQRKLTLTHVIDTHTHADISRVGPRSRIRPAANTSCTKMRPRVASPFISRAVLNVVSAISR